MAKKVRKPRSANPRTFGQSGPQPAQTVLPTQAAPVAAVAPKPVAQRAAKQADLRAEYPYVGRDLRNLALTAAAMFAVLIVLNLALNFVR